MLLFATGNRHKFDEVSKVLAEFGIELGQEKMDLVEIPSDSLEEIALHKAKQAFAKLKQPLIAEDTGFFMEAYKGFPGTNPKWVVERIGLEGILKLASGKSRKGYFQTVICFIESPESYRFFEGKMHGKLSKKIINPNADTMPYNKIFIPDGDKRVLAEMSEKEKLSFLQRTIATRKLGKWLKEKVH